jgi:UDP-N-acetylglucosamine 2-epimerase (non-hydrolysing)
MFYALRDLAAEVPDLLIFFPVHLNPNVRNPAHEILGSSTNIVLTEPLDYFRFVQAMSRAELILTDSGGIQEEAISLGVPVLVLRNETERPEGLETGIVHLAGTKRRAIVEHAIRILTTRNTGGMHHIQNPYGDGKASARIVKEILRFLGVADWRLYDEIAEFRPKA